MCGRYAEHQSIDKQDDAQPWPFGRQSRCLREQPSATTLSTLLSSNVGRNFTGGHDHSARCRSVTASGSEVAPLVSSSTERSSPCVSLRTAVHLDLGVSTTLENW